MKSTVEQLSPTRVRINVEVPFTELQPEFDQAYKELAKQVRLPGFRPDQGMYLKFVDPEESEGEQFSVYEAAVKF